MEIFIPYYAWIKSFHIISIICWMAAMFYLPRLYVYHSQTKPHTEASDLYTIMESKLIRIIMTPAMISSYIFGIMLLLIPGVVQWSAGWIHIKLAMVFVMTGLHGLFVSWHKKFIQEKRDLSHVYFRVANEIPVVIMVVIVIMVVVKPF
ncbi:MAG: protoporphyrinogen oxidase HemJ [Alphaproteobacteria bacterium]|nr:protoporphyrinogen oxidase HemJ [Alphaproteobacteria bacterium]